MVASQAMERLLVLDLGTGPWLSVGRISICDSAALKASRFRQAASGKHGGVGI
jgi:hypothetical protein